MQLANCPDILLQTLITRFTVTFTAVDDLSAGRKASCFYASSLTNRRSWNVF